MKSNKIFKYSRKMTINKSSFHHLRFCLLHKRAAEFGHIYGICIYIDRSLVKLFTWICKLVAYFHIQPKHYVHYLMTALFLPLLIFSLNDPAHVEIEKRKWYRFVCQVIRLDIMYKRSLQGINPRTGHKCDIDEHDDCDYIACGTYYASDQFDWRRKWIFIL